MRQATKVGSSILKYLFILFIFCTELAYSQVFKDGLAHDLVKKGADHIYNSNRDSAYFYAKKLESVVPGHPIIPLMRGMAILWANIPTISPRLFSEMESKLDSAVLLAKARDPNLEEPEMIFLCMASYGILAEYYADQGFNIKAVGEANHAYSLLKKGSELVDEFSEFLLTTGLYNYFIEKYPEKYPIYKPLVWFFESGDKALGIKQLEQASRSGFLTKVEADIYLSYIYLRYEYKPELAKKHLQALCETYPQNFFAKAKYIESIANPEDFQNAPLDIILKLKQHRKPYYKMAGYVFQGYYDEVVIKDSSKAKAAYRKGLAYGAKTPDHGAYFKSFGYLGLGRILQKNGKEEEAKKMLNLALEYSETEMVSDEAEEILSKL